MLKALCRNLLSISIILLLFCSLFITASAEEVKNSDAGFSLTLPEGYVLLDGETAEDNVELIDSLGYTVSSFKAYLKASAGEGGEQYFIALEPSSKAQITLKSSVTEFSSYISEMSYLNDDAMAKTAKELVQLKGATYKTVTANGMKLIEVRSTDTDSGGEFCSVQYITVRNGKIYTMAFTRSGSLTDAVVEQAWKCLTTLKIDNDATHSPFDAGTILLMFLLGIVMLAGVVVVCLIIYSIIRDIAFKKSGDDDSAEYIRRRK